MSNFNALPPFTLTEKFLSQSNISYVDETVLKPLRDTIVDKPPYASGVLPLPARLFKLFYVSPRGPRLINLANATESELQELTDSCLNTKGVLDETYPKAGKMDCENYATPLGPERTSLVDIIRAQLLEGESSQRRIEVELHNLNVHSMSYFRISFKLGFPC